MQNHKQLLKLLLRAQTLPTFNLKPVQIFRAFSNAYSSDSTYAPRQSTPSDQKPPQQGEIRLQRNPYENPNQEDEQEEGHFVPEIFRQNRHKYSQKPTEVDGYRKQIVYRAGHIGTMELEVVLRDWLALNVAKMSYEELEQFDQDVLDIENP